MRRRQSCERYRRLRDPACRPGPPPPNADRSSHGRAAVAYIIRCYMLAGLLDLVLAPICLGCDNIILAGDSARLVCRKCRANLKALPSPSCKRCGAPVLATGRTVGVSCPECAEWPAIITRARAACLLHPPGDRLVHQLKYR